MLGKTPYCKLDCDLRCEKWTIFYQSYVKLNHIEPLFLHRDFIADVMFAGVWSPPAVLITHLRADHNSDLTNMLCPDHQFNWGPLLWTVNNSSKQLSWSEWFIYSCQRGIQSRAHLDLLLRKEFKCHFHIGPGIMEPLLMLMLGGTSELWVLRAGHFYRGPRREIGPLTWFMGRASHDFVALKVSWDFKLQPDLAFAILV